MDQESTMTTSRLLQDELRGPALRERLVLTIRGIDALYPSQDAWEARHAQYIQDYFNVPLAKDRVHAKEVGVEIDVKKIESSLEGQGDSIFERTRYLIENLGVNGNLRGSKERRLQDSERRLAGKYIRVLYDQTTTWKAAEQYDDLYVATQPFMTRQGTSTYYKQFKAFSPEYNSITSVGSVLVDPPPEGAIEIDYDGAIRSYVDDFWGSNKAYIIGGVAAACAALVMCCALLFYRTRKRRTRRNSGRISELTDREFNRSMEINRSVQVGTFATHGTYDTTHASGADGGQGMDGRQDGVRQGEGKKKWFRLGRGGKRQEQQYQDNRDVHHDMHQDSRALSVHQNPYATQQDSREFALRESRELELRRRAQDEFVPQRLGASYGPANGYGRDDYSRGNGANRSQTYSRGGNYGGGSNYDRDENYGQGERERQEHDREGEGNKKFSLFRRSHKSDTNPAEDDDNGRWSSRSGIPDGGWSGRFGGPGRLERNDSRRGIEPDSGGNRRGMEPEDPSEHHDDRSHDTSFDVDSFIEDGVDTGMDADGLHGNAPPRRGSSVDKARSQASSSRSIRFVRTAEGVLTAELQRSVKSDPGSMLRASAGSLRSSTGGSKKAFHRIDVDAFNDSFKGEITVAGLIGYDVDSYVEREEEMVDVIAPAGKLDVVLVDPEPPDVGHAYVEKIKEGSSLMGKLRLGDKIIAVDEEDVRDMTAMDVSKLLAIRAANTFRRIAVLREKELPDPPMLTIEEGVDVDSYNVTPTKDNTTSGKAPAIDPSEVESVKEAVNTDLTGSMNKPLERIPKENKENEASTKELIAHLESAGDSVSMQDYMRAFTNSTKTEPAMQSVPEEGYENDGSATASQDETEREQTVKCAAKHLCQAGLQCVDLRNSLYQCMNCRGRMHNVSTCGEVYSRVEKVYGFAIPKENLSLHGQTVLFEEDESDLMICSSCLEMLILF